MKKLIWGIIIGLGFIILGVWGYSYFNSIYSGRMGPKRQVPRTSNKVAKTDDSRDSISRETGKDLSEKKEVQLQETKRRDSSRKSFLEMLPGEVSSAVQSFSGNTSEDSSSRQALVWDIKELKGKGKEGIAELLRILENEGSDFFKMVAAGVLGEVYSETQNLEVKAVLENKVLPLIQNIMDRELNKQLKYQAVNTLGELGIQGAQDMLMDILLDDTDWKMQIASVRVIREKGNPETVSKLVEMLKFSQDIMHIMWAAATLGKMTDKFNDPSINEALQASISKIEKVFDDENQIIRIGGAALMTLGELGTPESIESMIRIMEKRAGGNNTIDLYLPTVCVGSLVRNGTQEIAEILSQSLFTSINDDARIIFASAICGMANRHPNPVAQDLAQSLALPALKDLCRTGKIVNIQKKAVRAIGVVGKTQDIEFLQKLGQENKDLDSVAYLAVQRIKRRESLRPLSHVTD